MSSVLVITFLFFNHKIEQPYNYHLHVSVGSSTAALCIGFKGVSVL